MRETKAGFRLPDDAGVPIIMIGPGTGLAPFRGFLQERAARKAKGASLGPAMLFFGCRHPDQDFLYADELKAFAAGGITELHTAFSRADGPKTYVQHLVAAQKDRVWSLIEQGAIIYVCGDGGKMEPDVKAALVAIYRERKRRRCRGGAALDRRARHQKPLRAGRLGGGVTTVRPRESGAGAWALLQSRRRRVALSGGCFLPTSSFVIVLPAPLGSDLPGRSLEKSPMKFACRDFFAGRLPWLSLLHQSP